MRTLLCALCAPLLTLVLAPAAWGAPQLIQGWQNQQVHAHEEWAAPMFQTIGPGTQVPVTTVYHNNPKTAGWVRWSDGSNVKQKVTFSPAWRPGAVFEARRVDTLTLSPAQFDRWGYREVRMSMNSTSPRDFGTSRWCVWVPDNGKGRSDSCGGPTVKGRCGGGWWYSETDYSIVFVDCRDVNTVQTRALVAGDRIRATAQAGVLKAHLDPDFHHANPGMALPVTAGAVTIPSGLAPGEHKLHLRDERTNGQAGAYVVVFQVA